MIKTKLEPNFSVVLKPVIWAVLVLLGFSALWAALGGVFQSSWTQEAQAAEEDDQTAADTEEMDEEERKQEIKDKQKELEKLEEIADKYEEKATEMGDKALSLREVIYELEKEVTQTENSIAGTQREIDAIQVDIDAKLKEIGIQEKELNQKKEVLAEYLRLISRLSNQSMLSVMLSSENLADYLEELNSLGQASDDIKQIYSEIKQQKNRLLAEKQKLEEKRDEHTSLKIMKEQQRRYLENKKQYKDELLEETEGEESRYQQLLAGAEKKVSKVSEELTTLQSLGSAIEFEDALKAAQYAAKKTDVRVAYLLGILRVESNMGNNVGGGNYKTDMHPAQREIFEEICEDLGYDPDKMRVSRKPCYRDEDGKCSGWGGAMGPAQFMPSTWKGYADDVAEVCDTKRPDPWNLRHALVAMGLKVAKVPGVEDGNRSAEKKAANIYLAGGNWERFTWYGDRVMEFADAFEKKIKEMGEDD